MGTDEQIPTHPAAVAAWLEHFEGRMPRHGKILRGLIRGVIRDPRIVQLSIGCSVARGSFDELSDLDCEVSLEKAAWPSGLAAIEPLVRECGDVVEMLQHHWAGAGTADSCRTAVVYSTGVQLDLMAWPVTAWSGMRPPNTIVLHATRPVFTHPGDPPDATVGLDRLREWRFLGWWALLDADKYLLRTSPWEARQRLEEARAVVWQLHAAAEGVPLPEYGITSLLDAPNIALPDGIERTTAGLDLSELRAAVTECARQLRRRWRQLAAAVTGLADISAVPPWAVERLGLSAADADAAPPDAA